MPEPRSNCKRSAPLWLALALILLFTWTVSAGSGTTLYLPVVAKQATPTPTITPTPIPPLPANYSVSYYVQTTSSLEAYNYGCALGRTDRDLPGTQDRLVILDFGQPWYENGQYGTIIFRIDGVGEFYFASMTTVREFAKNFAAGYWNCTGSDKLSHLTLGIGTSNYLGADVDAPMKNYERLYTHGKLWAQMVLEVNSWLVSTGYVSQVYVTGANDIEPNWATAAFTKKWVQGFDENDQSSAIYYDYGSCDGCPQSYDPNIANWPYMPSDWWVEDRWYVAWGVQPAWVVPEIYTNSGSLANQWYVLSKYARRFKGARIDFSGVMTQTGACAQRGGCSSTDNTPQEAWNQLWSRTYADPDTRMLLLPWMTDIRYWAE
ncbi:MAG: hypothetical protein GYA20_11810 [Chloroflexi bacterium]|nr:hypothetical protein [Chloroflexota bacterium]